MTVRCRGRRPVPSIVLVAVALVGCSGDDDEPVASDPVTSVPSTTPSEPATTAVPTTALATTTTTTITVPVIDPPTTPPATTTAPTSPSDLAADIEADLNEGEQAYIAAGANPGSVESQAVLTKYFSGTALTVVQDIFRQLVEGGLAVMPSPDVANVIEVVSEPTPIDGLTTAMQVDLCRIDAAWVVTPPAQPGGQPIIFNDESTKVVSRSTVVLIDGMWVLDGGVGLQPDESGATSCA